MQSPVSSKALIYVSSPLALLNDPQLIPLSVFQFLLKSKDVCFFCLRYWDLARRFQIQSLFYYLRQDLKQMNSLYAFSLLWICSAKVTCANSYLYQTNQPSPSDSQSSPISTQVL